MSESAMPDLAGAITRATNALAELVLRWNLAEIESADLGEFDNRARDWLREPHVSKEHPE